MVDAGESVDLRCSVTGRPVAASELLPIHSHRDALFHGPCEHRATCEVEGVSRMSAPRVEYAPPRLVGLRPFFTYYGGKWRTALKYPAPTASHIVEPFAGSAGYATRYPHHSVTLVDANPVICGIWDYLIHVRPSEVLRLPLHFDHVDELSVPPEARDLIGFWLNKGVAAPRRSPSAWMRSGIRPGSFWGEQIRDRIAGQVQAIRHWTIVEADYVWTPHLGPATWFVDPPYEGAQGSHYPCGVTDYSALGEWCRNLVGQVIVCEREGASWLPFEPLHRAKAMHGEGRSGVSAEAIWTSDRVAA